nr:F-box domain, leucine-rich repeat domain, L domain-like protein [Tanacetum cinerariifolium]
MLQKLERTEEETREEMRRLEAMGTYTDDEINRLAREGKQQGHIAGVGRVLPARATASPSANKRENGKIGTKPYQIKKKREASLVAWWLLGIDGEGRGSGVEVVEWRENGENCLAAGGNTFLKLRDNIQGYVVAAIVNYNQGNSGYCPLGVANQIRPSDFAQPNCLTADGNTFPEFQNNIQGYVSAVAVNYNQGNSGYRPLSVDNQIRPPGFAQPNVQNNKNRFSQPQEYNRGNNFNQDTSYQAPT